MIWQFHLLSGEGPKLDSGAVETNLSDALTILDNGVQKVARDKTFFSFLSIVCLVAMVMISNISLPHPFNFLTSFVHVCITVTVAYLLWMILIMSKWELNGLISVKKDVNNLLNSNPLVFER